MSLSSGSCVLRPMNVSGAGLDNNSLDATTIWCVRAMTSLIRALSALMKLRRSSTVTARSLIMQAGALSVSQPPTPTDEALVGDGETIHASSEMEHR